MNEYKEFLKHLGINPMLMVADMRSRLPASEKPVSVKENKEKYKEILRLKDMLKKAKIPFEFSEFFGGYHIVYLNNQFTECSVIEHDCSYGREKDLLEIRGLMTNKEMNREQDNVLGYLTAENVFHRIKYHWKKLKGR